MTPAQAWWSRAGDDACRERETGEGVLLGEKDVCGLA
jgi:hypothetical protein